MARNITRIDLVCGLGDLELVSHQLVSIEELDGWERMDVSKGAGGG